MTAVAHTLPVSPRKSLFCGVSELYDSYEAGYVWQSRIRVVEQLTLRLSAAVTLQSLDVGGSPADTVRDQTDPVCEFLLESLTDEDGHGRSSVKCGS